MADYNFTATSVETGSPTAQTGTPPTAYYTSKSEIERFMSVNMAAVRVDDYNTDETPPSNDLDVQAAIWVDICIAATDEVNFFLLRFHEATNLGLNAWVRTRATWIAAYLLSHRRGDPGLFQSDYERAIAQLEQINETRPVPRLPLRQEFTPAMSNMHVDDRFRLSKIRVEQQVSTGGTSARQNLDPDILLEPWGR